MSRTVSACIPTELHEELRERCNQIGESMNDFIKASIEFSLYGYMDFDFGNDEEKPAPRPEKSDKDESIPVVKIRGGQSEAFHGISKDEKSGTEKPVCQGRVRQG